MRHVTKARYPVFGVVVVDGVVVAVPSLSETLRERTTGVIVVVNDAVEIQAQYGTYSFDKQQKYSTCISASNQNRCKDDSTISGPYKSCLVYSLKDFYIWL